MNGIQMMFKSFGIDMEGIEKIVNPDTVKQVLNDLQNVASKLDSIDAKLTRIEIRLETIPKDEAMKLLANHPTQEELDNYGTSSGS